MAQVIHKGIKENGIIDAEIRRTPVLVTELIHDFPKMSQAEIEKALREIRDSAEADERTKQAFVHALKETDKSPIRKITKPIRTKIAKRKLMGGKRK